MFIDRVEPIGNIGAIAMQSVHLVQPQRGDHIKLGYIDLYLEPVYNPLHEIGSDHFPDPGFKIAAGDILMGLTGFEYRLLPDNSVALYLAS